MEYPQNIWLGRFAALRDRGVNTERRVPCKSGDVGALTDLTVKCRDALAKAEASAGKAAEAHLASLADDEGTSAERDTKGIADARAQKALLAASMKLSAEVEENREAIGSIYAEEADEAGAALVDLLSEALEVGQRYASSRAAAAAMRSLNPASRMNPPTAGKMPGGATLANLLAMAEREVGLAEPFDRVTLAEYHKLQRGEAAVTVDDRVVDALHGRVRVIYQHPSHVAVGLQTAEGGVA